MFRRFVSGSAVAAIAIAFVALVIMVAPALAVRRLYPIPIMWLAFAPLVWGLWAMLAPSAWVPQRLPVWGAILGLIGGLLGGFVLNLPSRVVGGPVPVILRGVALWPWWCSTIFSGCWFGSVIGLSAARPLVRR